MTYIQFLISFWNDSFQLMDSSNLSSTCPEGGHRHVISVIINVLLGCEQYMLKKQENILMFPVERLWRDTYLTVLTSYRYSLSKFGWRHFSFGREQGKKCLN